MVQKANILIVDDELGPRESLRMILKPAYNIYTAEDGHKALEIIKQIPIDLITLDLRMPGLSGMDVLKEVKETREDISVIIITGYGSLGTITTAGQFGVYDYISKPFNIDDVTAIVQKSLEKKQYDTDIRKLLEDIGSVNDMSRMERVKRLFEKSAPFLNQLIKKTSTSQTNFCKVNDIDCIKFLKLLSDILQNRTPFLAEHAERIHHYITLFYSEMELTQQEKDALEIATYFHDIGKWGLESDCAEFAKCPDDSQYQQWTKHPEKSIEILVPVNLSPDILSAILHHHERYDGKGFPRGLRGDEIPVGARMLRIANVYDALLLAKSYPETYSKAEALQEIRAYGGGELDPVLLQMFLKVVQTNEERLQ